MIVNRTELQFQVCCAPGCSGNLLLDTAGELEFLFFFCMCKYINGIYANPSFLLLKYRELKIKRDGFASSYKNVNGFQSIREKRRLF